MVKRENTDMAVAALSTSAIAPTASPAPTSPPQAAETSQAFARLVADARPDAKAGQDRAKPEAPAETSAEITLTVADEADRPASRDESGDSPAARPSDLLAEIEAMVAAASQLGTGQPIAAPATPIPTSVGSPPAEPDGVAARATAPAIPTAQAPLPSPILPKAAAFVAADIAGAATAPPAPAAAPTTSATPAPAATDRSTRAAAPPVLPIITAADATEAQAGAVLADGEPVAGASPQAPAPATRSGIATLIASLKSAFQRVESRDGTPVAVPTATAAEAHLATAEALAATAIPALATAPAAVTAPEARKPVVEGIAAPGGGPTDPIVKDAQAAPIGQPAIAEPAVAAATLPRAAFATALQADSAPVITTDIVPASADTAPPTANSAGVPDESPAVPVTDTPATGTGRVASSEAPAEGAADTAPLAGPAASAAPFPAAPTSVSSALAADTIEGPSQAEQSIDRHLDLARGNQWLDRLARDISQAATQQGHLKFQLNPEHLGALTVEIANSAAGTAIRLTAETDQARAIIADAQPRLLAEVRAQGLRVAESHVDLNQQGSGGSASAQGQQQHQQRPSADHKPFASTQNAIRGETDDSAPGEDGELYA